MKVLLSGGSAGGLSTYLHADHVGDRLPPSVIKYKAAPNSGFFLLHDDAAGTPVYPNEMEYVYHMQNSSGGVNQACAAAFAGKRTAWRCIFASLMRPGSVVVDMAAQSGGNVEGSVPGETVNIDGVNVVGNGNWSQCVARAATDMYANNIYNLVDEFFDNETTSFKVNLEDDILAGCVITHDGKVINDMLINAYKGA